MAMPATERRWTREEVLDLIACNPLSTPRYEVVDGVLLVTPAPSYAHQRAVGLMFRLLCNYLDREPALGEAFISPADVMPEQGVSVAPDVFVIPAAEANRIITSGPARRLILAVEMLSPGDRSGDRTRKRKLYQRTVPEYWIVDSDQRHVELWRPEFSAAVVHADRLEWHPDGASTPFVLDLRWYFATVNRNR